MEIPLVTTRTSSTTVLPETPEVLTGVHVMRGVGVRPAKGFWADAWSQVVRRPAAVAALIWIAIVGFFAVYAPVLASGHPLRWQIVRPDGTMETTYPLLRFLSATDVILLVAATAGIPLALFGGPRRQAATRWRVLISGTGLALTVAALMGMLQAAASARDVPPLLERLLRGEHGVAMLGAACALAVAGLVMILPVNVSWWRRVLVAVPACAAGAWLSVITWGTPLAKFDEYIRAECAAHGQVRAVYTLIPWSPTQRFSDLSRVPPVTPLGVSDDVPDDAPPARRLFLLGTDANGSDVLTQILHACRLAISIGVVSTGIALAIGVLMGAIMGYFGGWVDLVLYRVVEVFMAVPVLFLLIVAAAVLPPEMRSTYTMMAIIGCFTWTGMARFTRAEFLKLRNQDFVVAARAMGLPLRSVLFRHMLPNGVAPVLVDTSFAVAAAISIEAVLSYLNLGPIDQASWGRLLASALTTGGEFKWWLAVFPGTAIFLTVLAYNLVGEALRDAIDPKLKKAQM